MPPDRKRHRAGSDDPAGSNTKQRKNETTDVIDTETKPYGQTAGDDIYQNRKNLKHPTTARAREVDANPPLEELKSLIAEQDNDQDVKLVLHWFRSKDLRQEDNKGLAAASRKAQEAGVPLITMYLHSPADLEWHGTSPARTDFILECLKILRDQLEERHIPLAILTCEKRKDKTETIAEFIEKHSVTHVFANFEYEVDELRRDIDLMNREPKAHVQILHDQTVVAPGTLLTKTGIHRIFTPYYRAWLSLLEDKPSLLDLEDPPASNNKRIVKDYKDLFKNAVPKLPDSKNFASDEDRQRIRKLWPAGHDAALKRLDGFLKNKITDYRRDRSIPSLDPSSRLSPYFACGVLSVREAIARTKEWSGCGDNFQKSKAGSGISSWIRELVFREHYRQVLTAIPHNSMNLPQNLKYDSVHWEEDEEGWRKWCEGKTGMPFVDAGMRQLNHEAYMHNRLRMNTASYLTSNLLIDYRFGERYFAEHLIDWDLSNNTQGWEPSYTIFNPIIQGEKCDKDGDYIRKWVPELKDVPGKAIFAPYERLSKEDFEKLGYPKPHIDLTESRIRAKDRFKRDLAAANP